jgi:hypothetical protein
LSNPVAQPKVATPWKNTKPSTLPTFLATSMPVSFSARCNRATRRGNK